MELGVFAKGMKNFVTQERVANKRKAKGHTHSRARALFLSR